MERRRELEPLQGRIGLKVGSQSQRQVDGELQNAGERSRRDRVEAGVEEKEREGRKGGRDRQVVGRDQDGRDD